MAAHTGLETFTGDGNHQPLPLAANRKLCAWNQDVYEALEETAVDSVEYEISITAMGNFAQLSQQRCRITEGIDDDPPAKPERLGDASGLREPNLDPRGQLSTPITNPQRGYRARRKPSRRKTYPRLVFQAVRYHTGEQIFI